MFLTLSGITISVKLLQSENVLASIHVTLSGDNNFRQTSTIRERSIAYIRDAVGDYNFRQITAISERIITNTRYAVGDYKGRCRFTYGILYQRRSVFTIQIPVNRFVFRIAFPNRNICQTIA